MATPLKDTGMAKWLWSPVEKDFVYWDESDVYTRDENTDEQEEDMES